MPYTKYMKTLKDKKMKITQQRLEILRYLDENRTHPTLEQLYEFIRTKFPAISKMTVYNVISSLIDNRIISSMRFVNSTELRVDYDKSSHFHFLCGKCGKIYDIESDFDLLDNVKRNGHKFDEYTVNIYGTCKNCLKNK